MRDFSEFKNNVNDINLRSGIKIFDKQLKSIEGVDVVIDSIPSRAIILNHLNDMSETKEDRGINVSLNSNLKRGSYVTYNNETYIVMSDIDQHYYYKSAFMRKCQQTMNLKGWDKPIPCWGTNTSYGVKGEVDNNYFTTTDGKIQFKIQKNKFTDVIDKGFRFVFNHDKKYVYSVVEIENVLIPEIYTITMKDTEFDSINDDLVNNIAYNPQLDTSEPPVNPNPPPTYTYNLKADNGDMSLRRYNANTFRIVDAYNNPVSTTWEITINYNGIPVEYVQEKDRGGSYIKLVNTKGYHANDLLINFKRNQNLLTARIRMVN